MITYLFQIKYLINWFKKATSNHNYGKHDRKAKYVLHKVLDHLKEFDSSDTFNNIEPTYDSFKKSGLLDIILEREGIFHY